MFKNLNNDKCHKMSKVSKIFDNVKNGKKCQKMSKKTCQKCHKFQEKWTVRDVEFLMDIKRILNYDRITRNEQYSNVINNRLKMSKMTCQKCEKCHEREPVRQCFWFI